MDNSTLKSLLQEYEEKRIRANLLLEDRKKELYLKYPKFADIDKEINLLSIKKINFILSSNSTEIVNIDTKINALKEGKNQLFNKYNISDNFFSRLSISEIDAAGTVLQKSLHSVS